MGKFILQYRLSLTTQSICLCATINYLITPILANLCLKGRLDLGGEKKNPPLSSLINIFIVLVTSAK